jgi:plastocyanin
MKHLKNPIFSILFLNLILFSGLINAQSKKIIFSNNNQQTDIVGNASINVATGDITVQTSDDKYIIDGSSAAIVGFYPDKYQINVGDSITVKWATAHTTGCTASVPSGNAPTWSGSKTGNTMDNEVVTISSLPTTLRLNCNNMGAGSVTEEFILTQNTGGTGTVGNEPVVDYFQVNVGGQWYDNLEIPTNNFYQVRWSVSDATSCEADVLPVGNQTSSWKTQNRGVSGTQAVNFSGEPTLSLICRNANGNNVPKTFSFPFIQGTGNGSGTTNPPSGCSTPSHSMSPLKIKYADDRAPDGNAPVMPGEGVGSPYGTAPGGGTMFGHLKTSQYIELEFNTPSNPAAFPFHSYVPNGKSVPHSNIKLHTVDASTYTGNMEKMVYAISQCPGDFSSSKVACSGAINKGNDIFITTDGSHPYLGYSGFDSCLLGKGERYYLNFFSGTGLDAVNDATKRKCKESNPQAGKCGIIIQESWDGEQY